MVKSHLKRHNVPRSWKINRKENTFVVRPRPAGHSLENSMPVTVVMRDMLKLAKTVKEIKYILKNHEVFINSKRVHDHKASLGLLEVLSIPKEGKYYRMLLNKNGKLEAIETTKELGQNIIGKLMGKTMIGKGKVQLNFLGGYNMIVDKDEYKTHDSLLIDFAGQKIVQKLSFEKGNMVYLFGGKHKSDIGTVQEVLESKFIYKNADGEIYETLKRYGVIVGKDKPLIRLTKNSE